MAPVLQCPDCGQKHPLASVPEQGAFACRGCGRALKVPEVAGRPRAGAPGAESAGIDPPPDPPERRARPVPVATAVARPSNGTDGGEPTTGADAVSADAAGAARASAAVDERAIGRLSGRSGRPAPARLGRVPWWMRLLLWFVAVPLSFLVVFVVARALGVFTSNQLSDLFLANNRSRFWPVARLLPFVALVTATFVQLGVYGLARVRGRSRAPRTRA